MNTPKTITEIEKEYRKKFISADAYTKHPDDTINFIRQSINEILDSIPLEEIDIDESGEFWKDNEAKHYRIGFNQAIKEIKHKLNKIRL